MHIGVAGFGITLYIWGSKSLKWMQSDGRLVGDEAEGIYTACALTGLLVCKYRSS